MMMPRMVKEWIGKTPQAPVPPRVKLRLYLKYHGRCQHCTRPLSVGETPHFDHVVALCNGGENRESNLQLLCTWCHRQKTKADVAEKSRTYRKARKARGFRHSRRPIMGWKNFRGEPVRNPRLQRGR